MHLNRTDLIFLPALATTVVVFDLALFRHQAWSRLVANIVIVLFFLLGYVITGKRNKR